MKTALSADVTKTTAFWSVVGVLAIVTALATFEGSGAWWLAVMAALGIAALAAALLFTLRTLGGLVGRHPSLGRFLGRTVAVLGCLGMAYVAILSIAENADKLRAVATVVVGLPLLVIWNIFEAAGDLSLTAWLLLIGLYVLVRIWARLDSMALQLDEVKRAVTTAARYDEEDDEAEDEELA